MPIVKPAPGLVGDVYFNSHWGLASVHLYEYDVPIEGFYGRYNIYFDELDLKTQQGERALASSKVKSFVLQDSLSTQTIHFVNSNEYTSDGVPLTGFFEVLVAGQTPLFKRHTVIVKDPDYHPSLNAGSRDVQISRRSDYYAAFGKEVTLVKGKKKILASFGDKAAEVEAFIKTNKLSASERNGLIHIFTYYNSLLDKP